MHRIAPALTCALLLATAALVAGCGGGPSGLTTGATAADAQSGDMTNENPMARPFAVAWTSARAKRCGFYFDPAKLRSSYLAYESQHGVAGEQLAKIQNVYDSTFNSVSTRISADPDYCSDRKGADIKADLQRYLAGDYTPNLPKPKAVASCGFFGCGDTSSSSDKPFDSKEFWKKQDADPKSRR
jgi:hypothetical protein